MTAEIPLSRGLVAIVDDEDYDAVTAVGKWSATPSSKTFYARRTVRNGPPPHGTLFMHTFLMGTLGVDHRNGNGLDNRRANLRIATHGQNMRNRGLVATNSTGYKGVQYRRPGVWRARIQLDRKQLHLGQYPTPEEAAEAYNAAAIKYFGEFALLNETP